MSQSRLLCLVFVLLCVNLVKSLWEGDPCSTKDKLLGVCRNVTDCPYAIQLIGIDHVKPTHCAYHKNGEEVVCCPIKDNLHATGRYLNVFGDTQDGVIRSNNLICWYDGNIPFLCCEDKRNDELEPEPKSCPALEKPSRSLGPITAWEKCVEFQRYVNVCEQVDGNPQLYKRMNGTCVMTAHVDRIFGGEPALDKEFPHMALLGCRHVVNDEIVIEWVAAGTLISDRFILTAAHVISHPVFGLVRYVLLGTLAKSSAREGVLHNVVRHEKHKFYSAKEKYNDIALLELDTRVIFSDFIRPACLSTPGMRYSKTRVVAGWGGTEFGPSSDSLMKVHVKQFNSSFCSEQIDPQGLSRGWDAEAMICAGGSKGQSNDSCPGDSGGPLMAYMKDLPCSYVVLGIVSWGSQCGQGSPGAYTNVENYLDWITERVWPLSNSRKKASLELSNVNLPL